VMDKRPLKALTKKQLIDLIYDLDWRVRYKSFAYQEYELREYRVCCDGDVLH